MNTPRWRVFRARMDELADAIAHVEAHCARHGVAHAQMLRLTLIVEELFTNTVAHGHGGDSDAPIRIALEGGEPQLTLHFEDTAPPFDPSSHPSQRGDAAAEAVAPRIGGLGVRLAMQMAHDTAYAYEDGRNRLRIVLRGEG